MYERKKVLSGFYDSCEFFDKTVKENIEKYRKGDVKIFVVNKDGSPVKDAQITLNQLTHHFKFGANIFMLDELETEEKNEQYKKYFAETFNMATLPFYWRDLEPEKGKPRYDKDSVKVYRRPAPDLCIEFCEQNGIEPREHALAYDHWFPYWLKDYSVDEVKKELERRYAEISERYADKIPTIEVTNEMEWASGITSFYDEPDFVEWCFKTAEKYFTNNQLGINEHQGLTWKDKCRFTDKYYAYIEANMLKGARIDAIGMQFHLFNKREQEYEKTRQMLDPQNLYKHMDLYSNFGKPLQITEVTVPAYSADAEDEAIQAEILEKLYSIWFSHPNVEQIIYWNLVDGYANGAKPGDMTVGENYYYGGLIRFDMTPKPAFLKLKELLEERWHTEAELVTDENGKADFRGFYGDYSAEVAVNGKVHMAKLSLSKASENNIDIVL